MGNTSKIFHLHGTTQVWCFFCLQVKLCDAKMRKGCYKLILGEGKNSLSQMLEILQDEGLNKIVLRNED